MYKKVEKRKPALGGCWSDMVVLGMRRVQGKTRDFGNRRIKKAYLFIGAGRVEIV